jgi:hypothetical protein
MMTNLPVLHSFHVSELANLEAVSGCEHDLAVKLLEFIHDWLEERNVRRILKVNPDLSGGLTSSLQTPPGLDFTPWRTLHRFGLSHFLIG